MHPYILVLATHYFCVTTPYTYILLTYIHMYIHTVAMQQAGTVAGNIAKYLKSSNSSDGLSIFKYLPLGEMLTLG